MLDENRSAQPVAPVQSVEKPHMPGTAGPAREPLAIIGIGCHFPGGATSPQAFWDLLCSGTDATREVPSDRWDVRKFYDPDTKKSGKMNTFRGGYLERLDQFDAHFFGISPREAMWLDPQQRLLLQVTWEALEDAGQVADQLSGSNTGVFIGGFTLDYQLMQNFGVFSRYELQTHSATGMMMTMLANRLSYVFGFHGPSMAVDTACSGSLVAVHLACQSIWNGECSLAIAGGANAMIAPTMTIAESKGGFLSPDGRCKTFDSSANGYARGEGAGVVLIKPLSRAQADGDPIYALIRGTAVTQDGHTNGITVPNGRAQEEAMRLACQRAGILPEQISYVEAHGTGTPVGDPIEARAIGTVVSANRPTGESCIVSSVKTNIGHLEAASGVAGLVKTSLILKNRQVPPHLHFNNPNPDIPFDELQLRVPTTLETLPATNGPTLAGVNSFGFGGTNAHVVLQEAPAVVPDQSRTDDTEHSYLLPLSARSAEALQDLAGSYRTYLAGDETHSLHDIVYSAALRRSHHDHRLALVAHSKAEAAAQLEAFLSDEPRAGTSTGRVAGESPKTVFVCSGMGPQWWAMGRDLLAHEPIFRSSIERCSVAFEPYTGRSLIADLTASEADSHMAEVEVAELANFALQVALAELWRSWGIEPDAFVGHSTGEFAAHYLAGALSFEDAIQVVYHHSRLHQRTSGSGRMLAVGMSYETLSKAEMDTDNRVSIAAINGPSAVTLSGESSVLDDVARQLETFQVFYRFLAVDVPYHSHFTETIREELLTSLADLHPQSASLPLYSTVTGTRIDGSGVDARYWWQNSRATVLFSSAISQMIDDGYNTFIELSPHPVLTGSIVELLAQQEQSGTALPSLRRKEDDRVSMLGSLGTLYTRGYPLAWSAFSGDTGTFVRLPAYPWQLKPYWTESIESREDRLLTPVHPLLGQRMSAVHPSWEMEVNARLLPYLTDHRIQENILLPGAAFAEIALAAAREVFGQGEYLLEELTFRKALFLLEASDVRLRTVLNPELANVEIYSYTPTANGEARWTLHSSAKLRQRQPNEFATHLNLAELDYTCSTRTSREEFYQQSQQMGFQYGPAFQAIQQVDVSNGSAIGYLQVPEMLESELTDYAFHPALLDAAFQVLLTTARSIASEATTSGAIPYLPVGIERVRVLSQSVEHMRVHARLRQADDRLVVGDIQIVDSEGKLLAEIEGFRAQSLASSMSLSPERIDKGLYELDWQLMPYSDETAESEGAEAALQNENWLIFTDQSGVGEALVRSLAERGTPYTLVSHTNTPELTCQGEHFALDPTQSEQFQKLFSVLAARTEGSFSRVIHLWSLDSTFSEQSSLAELEQEQLTGSLSIVYLMQTLSQSGWAHLPRIWLVTRRAQTIGQEAGPVAVEQAPIWGLGRVIGHQEFTSMWGGLIDLDIAPATEQAALLFEEIEYSSGEDQVAFRQGQRYVARLIPGKDLTPPLPATFRSDGSYLITGGLGSLGLLVARWMVTQGARRLILMGRTQVPPRATWHELAEDHPQRNLTRALIELERLGATIHLAAVDVADEEQLSTFLTTYEREAWPPIRGVIHTAGVVQDELLLRMDTETFQRVLRPKVRGGWLLHRLLQDYPLDFFVLFSSTGSVIASLGQGNYAAGNAFLDALAYHRRSLGLPAISIGWGPWSIGMVEQLKLEQFYARRGIELITPEIGTQILGRVLGQRSAQLTAITANWTQAREASPGSILPLMFSQLENQADATANESSSDDGSLLQQLEEAEASERQSMLVAHLHQLVARVLQLDATQFTEQETLTSLGLDSMMAIEVKHRIEASLKIDISVLELLQEVTLIQLAVRILASLQFGAEADATDAPSLESIQDLIDQADSGELERLLAELEQALEDEATV